MSTPSAGRPPRRPGAATGLGMALVALVIAGGLALPAGDDADPDRCRGVTLSQSPPLVTLAGLKGCGDVSALAAGGTVRYDGTAQCFVLDPVPSGPPALLVWPDGSRLLAGRGPTVFVPDRSGGAGDEGGAGGRFRGGSVAAGSRVEGVGPALAAGAVDRISGPCRSVVGDRVVTYARLRILPP